MLCYIVVDTKPHRIYLSDIRALQNIIHAISITCFQCESCACFLGNIRLLFWLKLMKRDQLYLVFVCFFMFPLWKAWQTETLHYFTHEGRVSQSIHHFVSDWNILKSIHYLNDFGSSNFNMWLTYAEYYDYLWLLSHMQNPELLQTLPGRAACQNASVPVSWPRH